MAKEAPLEGNIEEIKDIDDIETLSEEEEYTRRIHTEWLLTRMLDRVAKHASEGDGIKWGNSVEIFSTFLITFKDPDYEKKEKQLDTDYKESISKAIDEYSGDNQKKELQQVISEIEARYLHNKLAFGLVLLNKHRKL